LNTPEEELAEITSKYDDYAEFREKEKATYALIVSRGLTKKLCGHMKHDRRRGLSDDDLAEIVSHYDTLKDLREKDPTTYSLIHSRGLSEELFAGLEREERVPISDEELAVISSKYNDLTEFYSKEGYAYHQICERGLLDKLCGRMKRKGNLFRRKIYAFTFSDGYAYVGLAQDPEHRLWEHTHPLEKFSPVYKHILNTGATYEFNILTDWLSIDVVGKVENDYINQYKAEGWKMLNRARGGGLGAISKLYTEKRIIEEISKYDYIEDFRKGSPNFYRFVRDHHLIEEYCSHMKHRNNPK
jgi:hypothetical protein